VPAPVVQSAPAWKERAALPGHQGTVQALSFGADFLASGGLDGRVKCWDVRTGKEQRTLFDKKSLGEIVMLAVRNEDRHLGIVFRNGNVYSLTLYNLRKNVGGGIGGPGLRMLAMLNDGQTVASASGNGLLLREYPLLNRQNLAPDELYLGHTGAVHAVAFSADEQVLATASADQTVRLWTRDKAEAKFIGKHGSEVLAVALTPDGKTLASADKDGQVMLWDAVNGKVRAALKGHQGAVRALAVDPAGKLLASAGDDGTVRLWDVAAGKQLAALPGHKGAVHTLAFSRDGRTLASGGADKTVRLWSAEQ
jgi:WD40 repeat protein